MGRVEQNKQLKLHKLMDSAFHLFTSKGISRTSISDIAGQAGAGGVHAAGGRARGPLGPVEGLGGAVVDALLPAVLIGVLLAHGALALAGAVGLHAVLGRLAGDVLFAVQRGVWHKTKLLFG